MSDMDPPQNDAAGTYRHSRFTPKPKRRRTGQPSRTSSAGGAGASRAPDPGPSRPAPPVSPGPVSPGPVPPAAAPPAGEEAAPSEAGALFDSYSAQWEKRHRRSLRWHRIMTVLRKLAWAIVAIVPLAALASDIGTTMRCEVPGALIDARLRQQWMASWALSTAVVLPLAIFISLRARQPMVFVTAVGFATVWKVAVLLRDRVALPACPRGWSDDVPRHALEMPLGLVAGVSFAGFLVALAVLAWSPRRSAID